MKVFLEGLQFAVCQLTSCILAVMSQIMHLRVWGHNSMYRFDGRFREGVPEGLLFAVCQLTSCILAVMPQIMHLRV